MDLKKAVPPWRNKSWRKRYRHTTKMQNAAKLAAGPHRGHEARKHPASEGVRGGHRSWPFMHIGLREPPFLAPTGPLHHGYWGFISCFIAINVGFILFSLSAMSQALICDQFESADRKFFSDFFTENFHQNKKFRETLLLPSLPVFGILAGK